MKISDYMNKSSGNIAKKRLQMVLVSDRVNCSPDIMEQIKQDMIHVLSKYVEVDLKDLDFRIEHTTPDSSSESIPSLRANIPL